MKEYQHPVETRLRHGDQLLGTTRDGQQVTTPMLVGNDPGHPVTQQSKSLGHISNNKSELAAYVHHADLHGLASGRVKWLFQYQTTH